MAAEIQRIAEQGVLTLPDATWQRARQRMDVVRPLAALDLVGHLAGDAVAHSLGLSRRRVRWTVLAGTPQSEFTTGLQAGVAKQEPVNYWREASKAIEEAMIEARHNPERLARCSIWRHMDGVTQPPKRR